MAEQKCHTILQRTSFLLQRNTRQHRVAAVCISAQRNERHGKPRAAANESAQLCMVYIPASEQPAAVRMLCACDSRPKTYSTLGIIHRLSRVRAALKARLEVRS